jgi:hypothetical protein
MSDKISTQNMGTTGSGLSFTKKAGNPNDVLPMPIKVLTSFTEQEQNELKVIFKKALQEYFDEAYESSRV